MSPPPHHTRGHASQAGRVHGLRIHTPEDPAPARPSPRPHFGLSAKPRLLTAARVARQPSQRRVQRRVRSAAEAASGNAGANNANLDLRERWHREHLGRALRAARAGEFQAADRHFERCVLCRPQCEARVWLSWAMCQRPSPSTTSATSASASAARAGAGAGRTGKEDPARRAAVRRVLLEGLLHLDNEASAPLLQALGSQEMKAGNFLMSTILLEEAVRRDPGLNKNFKKIMQWQKVREAREQVMEMARSTPSFAARLEQVRWTVRQRWGQGLC